MKKIIILFSTISIFACNLETSLKSIEYRFEESESNKEISMPKNYAELVDTENDQADTFLENEEIKYSELINRKPPFDSRIISINKTKAIVEILNDTSTYIWGELGTPNFDYSLVYYGLKNEAIGITKLDLGGTLHSHPNKHLMKWGSLSKNGDREIRRILFE